jgi:hypothetical protein
MKTLENYSQKIELPVSSEDEAFAKRRIDRVVRDENRLFEMLEKLDGTEYDIDPQPGRFETLIRGNNVSVEFVPETGQPISMLREAENGKLKSFVKWNDEGNIAYVKEDRNFETRNFIVQEKLEIVFDHENGIIYYEEDNRKELRE